MSHPTACKSRRRGFSYLETQVAAVLFMLTLVLNIIGNKFVARVREQY